MKSEVDVDIDGSMSRFMIYCDFTSNAVVVVKVDEQELEEEFGGDIDAYADQHAPSNTYHYFLADENTRFVCDENIVKMIMSKWQSL